MTADVIIDAVLALPQIRRLLTPVEIGGLGITYGELQSNVSDAVNSAVMKVATAYPWDFAIKETTFSTANGTASYTLKGTDNDCYNIFYIADNTTGRAIVGKSKSAMNQLIDIYETINPIRYWASDGRSGDFPKVKIYGTPTSVETLKYQYWRKNVGLSDMPEMFDRVLIEALASKYIPDRLVLYKEELREVIFAYDRPNAEPDIASPDPMVLQYNLNRSYLNGW